jgi:CCR4-NOT transcription complex subunit 7/8
MPPPGRYGLQGVNSNFQHMQQSQYQQHPQPHQHHQAQHNAMQLPPAGLGGHPGFMSGMSLPGANMNNGGFDGARLADGGGTGLASHSAQMSFARGGQMQQQQQGRISEGQIGGDGKPVQAKSRIRNVWKSNLASEMQTLRHLVDKYPYIAMVGIGRPFLTPL